MRHSNGQASEMMETNPRTQGLPAGTPSHPEVLATYEPFPRISSLNSPGPLHENLLKVDLHASLQTLRVDISLPSNTCCDVDNARALTDAGSI
jgi:hypothetical protein